MISVTRVATVPASIGGLERLAHNLWWIWHPAAHDLFRSLDSEAWNASGANPVRALSLVSADRLAAEAADSEFLQRYQAVMAQFEAEMSSSDGWYTEEYGHPRAPIAYLSAEYGVHASLPIYAGGLGILAGDYLKECSDLAVPTVAVGLLYSRGYTSQRIREDGWPEDAEETLDRSGFPISPVLDAQGNQLLVQLPVFDPPIHVAVWKVNVGRVPLYLMDADLEINAPWDREIAHHLYANGLELRLRQELALGMGGIRVLDALGIYPAALHINEGHPVFAVFERVRNLVHQGRSFAEAFERVRQSTIFTTHTPVPAGTDVFPFQLIEKYFQQYCDELGIGLDTILRLGVNPEDPGAGFNTTVCSLRVSAAANAVSEKHGEVARRMWAGVWPGKPEADVPIESITNGVHLPSWIDPRHLRPLYDRQLGSTWSEEQDRTETWQKVDGISDGELWHYHQELKAAMIGEIDQRAQARWQRDLSAAGNVVSSGALLDPDVLTLAFARRFTAYKRPDLLLHDLERFKRLLTDPRHPVQIVFAGKAHPADIQGKRLIQMIVRLAQDPEFGGRVAFVEDYDESLAESLVRGVDVWLNNPIPPLEASGTSGMKASLNGVPNLSILDGWWLEGYNGANGWALSSDEIYGDRTAADAEALYAMLENTVVPLYYQRGDDGVPHDYVKVMKAAIKSVAPFFGTRRMVKEYVHRLYVPALGLPTH